MSVYRTIGPLFFTEMFIEKFSTFYKTFVGIALFDWLPGQDKKLILEKRLFLKNHK